MITQKDFQKIKESYLEIKKLRFAADWLRLQIILRGIRLHGFAEQDTVKELVIKEVSDLEEGSLVTSQPIPQDCLDGNWHNFGRKT